MATKVNEEDFKLMYGFDYRPGLVGAEKALCEGIIKRVLSKLRKDLEEAVAIQNDAVAKPAIPEGGLAELEAAIKAVRIIDNRVSETDARLARAMNLAKETGFPLE